MECVWEHHEWWVKFYFIHLTNKIQFHSLIEDVARTNNVAEGWHNAYATTTGHQKPTIFKFIHALQLDENIARAKILSCESGQDPPPPKPKYVKRDRAIKNALLTYLKARENPPTETEIDSEEDEEEANHERKIRWHKSPTFMLLKAVAHNESMWSFFRYF